MSLLRKAVYWPNILYHGSAYRTPTLKPGIAYGGEKVEWDHGESNEYLYATSEKDTAVELGFASAIEKKFKLDRFQSDEHELTITASERIMMSDLEALDVYLYAFALSHVDGWMLNHNAHNGLLNTEFKTRKVVSYDSVEKVDMKSFLAGKKVSIHRLPK